MKPSEIEIRVRQMIRSLVTYSNRTRIEVIPGDSPPEYLGEPARVETRGGTPIRYPNAYAKTGWSNMIRFPSTERIEVGEGFIAQVRHAANQLISAKSWKRSRQIMLAREWAREQFAGLLNQSSDWHLQPIPEAASKSIAMKEYHSLLHNPKKYNYAGNEYDKHSKYDVNGAPLPRGWQGPIVCRAHGDCRINTAVAAGCLARQIEENSLVSEE